MRRKQRRKDEENRYGRGKKIERGGNGDEYVVKKIKKERKKETSKREKEKVWRG